MKSALLVAAMVAGLGGSLSSQIGRGTATVGGPPLEAALRIALAIEPTTMKVGRLTVSLQNLGASDFVVNLGSMLANGRVMFPDAVHLIDVDPVGKSRDLQFFDRRYPGVAGRVDDFVVALRSGATYTFTVLLDQYWSPDTKEIPLKWAAGTHRLSARFDGRRASAINGDMRGIALMNFWKGSVTSPAVEYVVTGQ